MSYTFKKTGKSQIEVKFVLTNEELEKYKKKALEKTASNMKIKGFRPGKVPLDVVEKELDPKYIEEYKKEIAIQGEYMDFLIKEKINPVASPKVKISKEEPMEFELTVAVYPDVELADYSKIKVPEEKVEIEQKEVDDFVSNLKKQHTTFTETDDGAKIGDRVEVNFEGFDEDGKEVANTKSKNHPIVIGDGVMIKDFEDNLIGLKAGEKKDFDATFPKDYFRKDFQNKVIKFKVEVLKVFRAQEPELNEDFIEKLEGKKIKVEEFLDKIKFYLAERKKDENSIQRENKFIEELVKLVKVEIPDEMVEEELDFIMEETKDRLAGFGVTYEKFLETSKTKADEFREKKRIEAEKRLKIRLALGEALKKEKFEISEKEIKDEMPKYERMYKMQEEGKKMSEDRKVKDVVLRIQLRKFFEKYLETTEKEQTK